MFEDSENVYMILELCENRTLVELLKKRRRLSEPEARFYLKQLLDAIQYMHSKRVIHRDLKLGRSTSVHVCGKYGWFHDVLLIRKLVFGCTNGFKDWGFWFGHIG